MYYKCHKVNSICGGSYIDSSEWKKKEKEKSNNKSKIKDVMNTYNCLLKKFNFLIKTSNE